MKCGLRTITLLSILYIISINGDGRLRDTNGWTYELYTPNALRHGIQGPAVSPTKVTVGSVAGQTIYQLDVNHGTFSTFVAQPDGEADDEVFGADGTLVWTSLLSGLVRSRLTNGTILVVGNNNPVSPNGIAYDSNGNAYYSTFPGVGLDNTWGIYKVDPKGKRPQQKVMTTSLPMNGFDFSATNEIYGPYPFSGQIVKINLNTQTETVIASGFIDPEAVRFSADKNTLYVLDCGANSVYSVNIRTGAKTLIVTVPGLAYLDNFRPYGNGLLMSDTIANSPIYYDFSAKTQRYVTPVSVFNLPQGISFANGQIYIADYAAQRVYNTRTEQLTTVARAGPQPGSAGAAAVNVSYGLYNVAATSKYLAFSCFYDTKVQIRDVTTNRVIVNSIPLDPTATPYTPYGLGFSTDQKTLLIADFGVGLRVNTGNQFLSSRIITVGDNSVVGVAISGTKANTAYVTTASGNLYTVNYATGAVQVLAAGLSDPEGIVAIDLTASTDVVIVANVGTKSLIKVYPDGTKRTVATNLPIGLAGPATLPAVNTFTGVTADNNGDVYVTSDLSDALIKVAGCGRD